MMKSQIIKDAAKRRTGKRGGKALRRLGALVLALVMAASLLPVMGVAAGNGPDKARSSGDYVLMRTGDADDLSSYIPDDGMTLQKNVNGVWVDLEPGEDIVLGNNYRLKVHFEGGLGGFQKNMSWSLGDNVKCAAVTKGQILDGSTVIGYYTLTEDGQVTVELTDQFLDGGGQELDMFFDMVPTKTPDETGDKFPWEGHIGDHTVLENTGELEVEKSAGWYNSSTGSIAYTVDASVTAGMVKNGMLKDVMGDGLTFRNIESIHVYNANGEDVTARYKEQLDALTKKAEEAYAGQSTWELGPLPELTEGMHVVVEYKGEVATDKRGDMKYTAKNTVHFNGTKPDGTPATEKKADAEKKLAQDQLLKTGDTEIIKVNGEDKEVIKWQIRVGSGQWDPFGDARGKLEMKDTLGTGLTFEQSQPITVQWCDQNGNVKGSYTIDWTNGVTITDENGKTVATYDLESGKIVPKYDWVSEDYILVTYYTDFDATKQPTTGFENTVENEILAPDGTTGKLPVGESVQKSVVDDPEGGYLTYKVVIEVPPASHMAEISGHGHKGLHYFYIQDQLDVDSKYYAINKPKNVTITARGKDSGTIFEFTEVPYTSGQGDGQKRETFQILERPNSEEGDEGRNLRTFRIYFNTARYGLGSDNALDKYDSIWDIDEGTVLEITYQIPYSTPMVDKDGNDTGKTLGQVLYEGERLDNKVLSRRSGADIDDEEQYWKTPQSTDIDKTARILNEGVVEYRVTFVNSDFKEGDPSRLIKKRNEGPPKEANTSKPTLTDEFDGRMEYVPGSLYVEVRSKSSNRLYATYKYTDPNPVSGNTLTAMMYEDSLWTQEPGAAEYPDKNLTDTFADQNKYVFVYKLQLRDEYRQGWDSVEDIKNTATVDYTYDSASDDTTVDIPSDMLQKSFEVMETGNLKYTLQVNPLGVDLVMIQKDTGTVNLDSYKLVDKMSENLQLFTNPDGSYAITVEYCTDPASDTWVTMPRSGSAEGIGPGSPAYYLGTEADGSIYFILPDETPIRITYEVLVTGQKDSHVLATNEATLYADHTETDQQQTFYEVGESGATGKSTPVVRLQKTDGGTKSLQGVEFTLYSSQMPKNANGVDSFEVKKADGSTVKLYAVKTYTTNEYGETEKIEKPTDDPVGAFYALVETKGVAGYVATDEPVFFRFADYTGSEETVTYEGKEYTIENAEANRAYTVENPPERSLQVKKVDATSNLGLKGVEFEIRSSEENNSKVLYSGTSDENGLIQWTDKADPSAEAKTDLHLGEGLYYLYEMEAPNGYIELDGPVSILVGSDGTVTAKIGDKELKVNEVAGTPTVELVIPNESGYVLPESGGVGTMGLYVTGSILVLAAGLALVCGDRRRKASR